MDASLPFLGLMQGNLEAVLKCYEKNNIAESFRILSCFLVVFAEFYRFRCSHRSLFNSQKHLKNHSQNFLKTFQNSFLFLVGEDVLGDLHGVESRAFFNLVANDPKR